MKAPILSLLGFRVWGNPKEVYAAVARQACRSNPSKQAACSPVLKSPTLNYPISLYIWLCRCFFVCLFVEREVIKLTPKYIHADKHAYIHIHMHTHLHVHVHAHLQIHVHIHIHMQMQIQKLIHMHIQIHIQPHKYT